MSEEIKNMIAAIGSVCEIASIMRDNLIKNGFTRQEAVSIVSNYVVNLLTQKNKED